MTASPTLERMIRAGCLWKTCSYSDECSPGCEQNIESIKLAISALDPPDDALIEAMEGAVNAARLNYDGTTGLDKVCARAALRAAVDHILGETK